MAELVRIGDRLETSSITIVGLTCTANVLCASQGELQQNCCTNICIRQLWFTNSSDTWHPFLLCWDPSLRAIVVQTLNVSEDYVEVWCVQCYPWATYTICKNKVLSIKMLVTLLFETPLCLHLFLTPVLHGVEWSASYHNCFNSRKSPWLSTG